MRRPEFNWIMNKRDKSVDAGQEGARVGLYILNLEDGNELDFVRGNYYTTPGV